MSRPWTRHERIGECDLYLGDCLEVLGSGMKVDHIITDPPFSAHTHESYNGGLGHLHDSSLSYASLTPVRARFMAGYFANASRGWIVWFTDHQLAPIIYKVLGEEYDRCVFAPLPWLDVGRSIRVNGDGPSCWTDWIMCARTAALHKWGTLPGGYIAQPGWRDKQHVGGKPTALMRLIVNDYSRPGDLVCDPCMGAGTTLVACAQLGRRGVGIEVDPETFDKACRRLEAVERQPGMFVPEAQIVRPADPNLFGEVEDGKAWRKTPYGRKELP